MTDTRSDDRLADLGFHSTADLLEFNRKIIGAIAPMVANAAGRAHGG